MAKPSCGHSGRDVDTCECWVLRDNWGRQVEVLQFGQALRLSWNDFLKRMRDEVEGPVYCLSKLVSFTRIKCRAGHRVSKQ